MLRIKVQATVIQSFQVEPEKVESKVYEKTCNTDGTNKEGRQKSSSNQDQRSTVQGHSKKCERETQRLNYKMSNAKPLKLSYAEAQHQ